MELMLKQHKYAPKWSRIILLVLMVLLSPAWGFQMMPEERIRELNRQGDTSFDYILNMVVMGLPGSVLASIPRGLQSNPNFNTPPNSFAPSNTQASAAGAGGDTLGSNAFDSNDPIQLRRRRRFSDFFNGYNNGGFPGFGGNAPNVPENGNLYGGNSRSFINYTDDGRKGSSLHNSFYGSFNFPSKTCPRQVDQSFVYQYSGDPELYPAVDIANELLTRSVPGSDLLFQCLSRQVVFPSDPPQIFLDPFLKVSNTTCRNEEKQLWSYESVTFTGRCWPLVNFQETPFFKRCLNRFCKCEADHFSFGNKENLCITEYETVSVWAYCERLVPNRRIVRDRIIVPDACTCTSVQCSNGFHHK